MFLAGAQFFDLTLRIFCQEGVFFWQEHICLAKIGVMSAYTTCLSVDYVRLGFDSVGLG